MNALLIRNVAANAAKQRQLDAVQSAAEHLARAITNAIAPDPSKLAEIKTAITNEYERCEGLRTNARADRGHLVPTDDGGSIRVPSQRGGQSALRANAGAERKPLALSADRLALAPKGE